MKPVRVMNLIATLATIAVNGLANLLPIAGRTTGQVSDSFPTRFTPAGYVFAIWGVIYFGLLLFSIFQILPAQRNNPWVERIGWWYVIASACNIAWIFAWHYQQFPLTMALIVGLLVSLIVIYRKLNVGREDISPRNRWFVQVPFSIYLGWLTVATIANASVTFYAAGWRGGFIGESLWVTILLAVALGIGTLIALRHRDLAYLAVFVWAFIGIAVKQSSYYLVLISAIVAAVVVGVLMVIAYFRDKPLDRELSSS